MEISAFFRLRCAAHVLKVIALERAFDATDEIRRLHSLTGARCKGDISSIIALLCVLG
jgi:hypothetical protein